MKHMAKRLELACERAIRQSAQQGAQLARSLAPVDSGALRASIRTQTRALQAEVIADAEYAAFVEYGSSRAPAQPFMLPMAREMRGAFMENVRAAVQEVIR